jgi:hypothetical protein
LFQIFTYLKNKMWGFKCTQVHKNYNKLHEKTFVKKFTHNYYTSSYVPSKCTIDYLYLYLLSRPKVTSKLDTCSGPIQILLTCKNQSPGIGLTYTVLKRTTCTNPNWPSFQHNNCLLGCFRIKWNLPISCKHVAILLRSLRFKWRDKSHVMPTPRKWWKMSLKFTLKFQNWSLSIMKLSHLNSQAIYTSTHPQQGITYLPKWIT